jgi:hypothetical protein
MRASIFCAAVLCLAACGNGKDEAVENQVAAAESAEAKAGEPAATAAATADEAAPGKPAAPAADQADPMGWREHRDGERGFRVMAPGAPKITTTTTPTVAGPAPTTQMMFQKPGDQRMGLMVMVAKISVPDSFDLEGGLNGTRDGMIRAMGGTLSSEKKIELGGVPARDAVFTANNPQLGQIVARTRFAYRGDTMYTALAMTRKGDAEAQTKVDRFIESFELLDQAAAAPSVAALAKATQAAGSAGIEVSAVSLAVTEKKFGKGKGGYYLKIGFQAEVASKLTKTQQIQVEAACMVAGKTEVSKGSTLGDKLDELAPGAAKRADVTPFILTPLASPPDLCNLTFSFRKTFREQIPIGDFCYRGGEIAEGRCGDVL